MAEVVSRINTFLRCDSSFHSAIHNHNHNNRHGVSSFPCALVFPSPKVGSVALKSSSSYLTNYFFGRDIISGGRESVIAAASGAQMSIGIGKAQRWWEKGVQPNMREITGAQDIVDSLLNAGDKLVVVDFFSPGCGGCRALHPKICQLAEMNPDVQFLQVNYEENKPMCYALNVHVLPFFRFYRGAQGRLCSFSCTNATIKKFKDALAKHTPDRCSLGPARGLEEKELLALAANKDLSFIYPSKKEETVPVPEQAAAVEVESYSNSENLPLPLPLPWPLPRPLPTPAKATQDTKEKALVSPGR